MDEVGQFIGNDTRLMLNLQTITEQLGTVCAGRAWVVVTSQEDLDAVLGELTASKQHDFSKIQGRFKTRLSLSSANVDEVIKRRLLAKNEKAAAPLAAAYEGKHDILRNQLSFVRTGMTFKQYTDQSDFADCYPFAAYQFTLVQKVFESIRKAGATGLHLSQGERSTLDAFQSAAKQVGDRKIGVLVPFHRFYPAVEGFLDTAVKRTIDQAGDNHALEPFDLTILKVLFLVRYVDEMPGSVDNLVTLCVDEIDADKLALRKRIEAALNRLESETLIARNGDLYFFLTNEERDIGREIKSQVIGSGEEERALGTLIFEDILGGARKHTYKETGRDFQFNRLCDDHPVGNKMDGAIEVAVISPLHTNYVEFQNDNTAAMRAMEVEGRVLVVLPDDTALGRELRTYLQTEHYVKTKHTGTLPDSTKRILRDRTEDNRARRERLLGSIRTLMESAKWYTYSKKLDLHASEPKAALSEAMEYLIANAYPKMRYIAHLHSNPKHEIQSILRANDVEQIQMVLDTPESNPLALKDLREYMRLCSETSREVNLSDMIEKRYGMRPYGWPELEIVLLVARLAVLKEITLEAESGPLPLERAYEHLTATSKQRKVVMALRQVVGGGVIKDARELCLELFGQQGPSAEDALYISTKAQLATWDSNLAQFASLAETGRYPGRDAIDGARHLLKKFVAEPNSKTFLERFAQNKPELLSIAEDYQDLNDFYINQRHVWEKLQRAEKIFSQNALHLEQDERARPALDRMRLILADTKPYSKLHEVNALIAVVQEVNDKLVEAARDPVVMRITSFLDVVAVELEKVSADAYLRSQAVAELNRLLDVAQAHEVSIAHLNELNGSSEDAFGRAMDVIAECTSQQPNPVGPDPVPHPRPRRIICAKDYAPAELLQTDADVDGFVGRLRDALKKALAEGVRIQVK
ncbi:MAG: BREX system P-loop protein BrxC [bacterium]|nr:BREX system P-loop protein BrxC [bacterium]